jgi:outer membrane protein assembly factor BamD (BamD/ComL family)
MINKHLQSAIIILSLTIFWVSCYHKTSKKQLTGDITKYENQLQVDPGKNSQPEMYKDKAKKLVTAYKSYIKSFPNSPNTPEYLFKAAILDAETFQNYTESISLLRKLRKNFPQDKRSEKALFLIGYTYSEKLQNYPKAKKVLNHFLKLYPKSELSQSVIFELKYPGKDINQIPVFNNT